jgi:DNA-binding NtrC family response regulator
LIGGRAAVQTREVRRIAAMVNGLKPKLATEQMETAGFQFLEFASSGELLSAMKQNKMHAAVVHCDLAGNESHGFDTIAEIRKLSADLPLIALMPNGAQSSHDEARRFGADQIARNEVELKDALNLALNSPITTLPLSPRPVASRNSLCDLIGGSEPMQRLYDAILRVADSSTTVMIRGESGTGKELVARAIVALGPRASKPFVGLNCAALPEALIESELFGHEKGAFTGAVVSRPGHIEMAHGGTLFLDEIATLPLALQTKLLRVLEDRAVQRLGGSSSKKIDFRLLTATNENLEEMVRTGRFREDLYYRIHVVPISVPPLRERTEDIALLADHFIRIYCAANNVPTKRLDLETLEVLEEGSWQGNIREFENLIQRLVLMVEDKTISAYHLPEQILYTSARRHESLLIPSEGLDFDKEMERIEAAYLRAALLRAGGKKGTAATLLRINDQRMKYLCRKYKIEKDS